MSDILVIFYFLSLLIFGFIGLPISIVLVNQLCEKYSEWVDKHTYLKEKQSNNPLSKTEQEHFIKLVKSCNVAEFISESEDKRLKFGILKNAQGLIIKPAFFNLRDIRESTYYRNRCILAGIKLQQNDTCLIIYDKSVIHAWQVQHHKICGSVQNILRLKQRDNYREKVEKFICEKNND